VAGDTLVADTWTEASIALGVAVQAHSQLQFFIDYTPISAEVSAAVASCEIQLLYADVPADTEDVSGGSGTIVWKVYTVEYVISNESEEFKSGFRAKTWSIGSGATDASTRDPTFSVSLGAKRIKLQIREIDHSSGTNLGNLIAKVGHQAI